MNKVNERLELISLIDVYGKLLTSNQLEILKQYYLYDLSIVEIAANKNISRMAVSDTLSKAVSRIKEFESSLHIVQNKKRKSKIINKIKKITKDDTIIDLVTLLEDI